MEKLFVVYEFLYHESGIRVVGGFKTKEQAREVVASLNGKGAVSYDDITCEEVTVWDSVEDFQRKSVLEKYEEELAELKKKYGII